MPTWYELGPTQSSIQVLSPTQTLPVVDAFLTTKPHGVNFNYWIAEAAWDAGVAPALLEQVSQNIEQIMSQEPVIAAVGSQQLDASGLLSQFVTFTVAYDVPGSSLGPATVDVDIPIGQLDQEVFEGTNAGLDQAIATIHDAYNKLKALAAG